MSGSYTSLKTKFAQLQTYVAKNAITSSGNNTFTGSVSFTKPVTVQDLEVIGQTTFTNTPHCSQAPLFAQDLANRAYVDSIVGQSGNGFILYLNKSVSILGGYQLSNSVTAVTTPQTVVLEVNNVETPIATFITDVGFPAILTLPSGLWNLSQWAYMSNTNGVVNLYFKVNIYTAGGVFVSTIATSGYSSDINGTSTNPDLYHLTATIPQTTLTTSQRLGIQLLCIANFSATGRNLTCVFEDGNYSFINTSIGLGTALLSQNNTWTGNNYYPTQPVGNSTKLAANTEFVQLGIANAKANFLTTTNTYSGDNFFLTKSPNNNSTAVATCAYADAQATISANAIIAGNSTFTGINTFPTAPAGTNTLQGANCAFVTNAIANSNNNLLTSTNVWTGINTFSAGIPVGDSSGRVATTIFVDGTANTQFNTILSSNNTFTGSNTVPYPVITDSSYKACPTLWVNDKLTSYSSGNFTFGASTLGTTAVTSDSSTKIATTAFVNAVGTSLVNGLLTSTNSWTGTNTAVTQTAGTNNTTIATTAFVNNEIASKKVEILASANNWTGVNTFVTQAVGDDSTKAATTQYAQRALNAIKNTFLISNTAWLGINTAPTAATLDTGLQIANLDYVKNVAADALTSFLGQNNNFSAPNSFDTPATSINNTRVATTAYVQNVKNEFLTLANTFTGVQSFSGVIPPTDNTNRVATTEWVTQYANAYYGSVWALQNITFTGTNTCITPTLGTTTTQMANCLFVQNTISDYITNTLPALNVTWSNMNVPTQLLGDTSTKCANTQFVQNALSNSYSGLLDIANTWSAGQSFVTQALGNSTLLCATTAFVQNALTNFLASAQTFASVQTFSAGIVPAYTPQVAGAGNTGALGFNYATGTLPTAQALTTNVVKNWNITTLPAGVWIITLGIQLRPTGAATVSSMDYGLYTTSGGLAQRSNQSSSTSTGTLSLTNAQDYNFSFSFVITQTAASVQYYFNTRVVWTVATAMTGVYTYSYVRIA
jgi:hypothetical protein